MNRHKVSIIVPIYNAASTLKKAFDSIISQTYHNIEIVAVNDGSKDDSLNIINIYAEKDSRIKIINKLNGGVASARQAGIEAASGDYAIHVDPDDWIEPKMIEILVAEAERTNSDIVMCDYYVHTLQEKLYITQKPSSNNPLIVLSELFQQLHGSCCNKLISSAYYNKVNFEIGINISEDLLYISKILLLEPKITYLQKAFYHYDMTTQGSLSKSYTANQFRQLKAVYNILYKLLSLHNLIKLVNIDKILPHMAYIGMSSGDLSFWEFRNGVWPYKYKILKANYPILRKLLIFLSLIGLKKQINNLIILHNK